MVLSQLWHIWQEMLELQGTAVTIKILWISTHGQKHIEGTYFWAVNQSAEAKSFPDSPLLLTHTEKAGMVDLKINGNQELEDILQGKKYISLLSSYSSVILVLIYVKWEHIALWVLAGTKLLNMASS